ncbi:MAG: PAS domain S-box protein, partial [Ferruginibacter sp.]
ADVTDPRLKILITERRRTGKVKGEVTLLRKDGSPFEAELTSAVFTDALGQSRTSMIVRDITERKKSADKLTESELRYRSIIEQATDAICIADRSMRIMDINFYGCQMLGYSKEEFLQLSVADLFYPEDLETNPFRFEELQSGQIIRTERRFRKKDGTLIEVEMSSKILEDGRFIVFGHDIAERKNAENNLKESEAKFRTLFEQNMAGVYQSTFNGEILNCNHAFARMLKYDSPEEILRVNASDLYFSPKDRIDFTDNVINQKNLNNYESVLKCKDGSPLYFIENISLRKNDKTGEAFFDGIMIDITEKKEAELQLKESNERYNLVSKATNDMVWDWDLVTGKVYRNKEGWKKIFRTGDKVFESDLIQDWDDRIHPEDVEKVKMMEKEIEDSTRDFFEVECRVMRDDGTYAYIHDRGNIFRNVAGVATRLIGATQDITQRKEAELQVAKSEIRFRSLVQNGSDLIGILDNRGYYLYSSPAVKRILGYEPEFMIGKNSFSFIHPDDISYIKNHLSKKEPNNHLSSFAFRFKNAQGAWRWLESKVTDMSNDPEVMGYIFNSRDITERKTAEEEIHKLSIIAHETVNAVIITDPEGKIVWTNEAFTKITEYEPDEVLGKKPGDFLQGEETSQAVVRFMHQELKKIKAFECDIINYSKTGRKYWLRIQCQPQFDENGKLKNFFALQTDITKEKEAEAILKTSEERYRYLFNNNPASIIIWDIETLEILEINETAVDMYGYCRNAFLAKTVLDLRLPEYHFKIKQFAALAREKSNFVSANTWKHINKSGEGMYMNIASHRIEFKGRPVILSLATNITEKVILENELENERLEKQKEITDAVISAQEQERQELGAELHDNINQILAGSLLYLGLAKKELHIEHPWLTETDNLITMAIDEIRNLSHSLIPPSLSESELVGALSNLMETTRKSSKLIISLQAYGFDESSLPDKLKLSIYRIVQEQFNNILKHAGAGKVIVRLTQDNEKTLLLIKDDGVGFDTGRKSGGVGLMNIKTRASLFNGELSIISSPGQGCEIRVLFN